MSPMSRTLSVKALAPLTPPADMMSAMTDGVESVLGELRASDPDLGMAAQAVLDSLTWGEGVEVITQEGVQQFLWYTLPRKFVCSHDEHVYLAQTAAILLDRLGLHHYASIARAEITRDVLDAYTRSDREGLAAFRRAQEASGIEPPDLEHFAWGAVMGPEESAAMSAVADALERAVAAGEVVPRTRGWRSVQRRVAARALDADHPSIPSQSWRTTVLTERLDHWTSVRVPELAARRAAVANRLILPIEPSSELTGAVEPLMWFLGRIASGVPATQKGNLGRQVVRDLAAERDWYSFDVHGPPHREEDVWRLHALHALGRASKALRRSGRAIRLTKWGQTMAADATAAWTGLVSALAHEEFASQAIEIVFLWLLDSPSPVPAGMVYDTAARLLSERGWRSGDGLIDARHVESDLWVRRAWLDLLGMVVTEGTSDHRSLALSPAGVSTGLAFLRRIATGPRRTVL